MSNVISIRGARTHNLKNIDIDIPRKKFVVITGVSGSGKSSLAFDTLLAEGQRQYVQSLSVYARQLFDQMPRPDVDRIEGLSPTISIDQRAGAPNPRSTVATITEIYDYLRVLMARVGDVACPNCGTPVAQQTPAQIEQSIRALPNNTRVILLAPFVRGRRGAHREALESIQKAGFVRARVDGVILPLDEIPTLAPERTHEIEAVVDRIVIREEVDTRLSESVRLAIKHGDGIVIVLSQLPDDKSSDVWRERRFNTRYACPRCQTNIAEIQPRTFSFNSPYGACGTCGGLGAIVNSDALPIGSRDKETRRQGGKEKDETPLVSSPRPVLGVSPDPLVSFSSATCPACGGTRLRPEARAVRFEGRAVYEITAMTATSALAFFGSLRLGEDQKTIASPLIAEIVRRLEFLCRVGADYLSLDRTADTLSGGERQRVRLATGIGSGLAGALYLIDEPSIGLHPRDNDRLIAALRDLQQKGNSVIVVEHDEAIMRASDYLIELGPGAGPNGGRIVAQGTPQEVSRNEASLTGAYLSGRQRVGRPHKLRISDFGLRIKDKSIAGFFETRNPKCETFHITGARENNLQNIDVEFPLRAFTCVTGVSGSGKSTLVLETLAPAVARALTSRAKDRAKLRQEDPENKEAADVSLSSYDSLVGAEQLDRLVQIDAAPIGRTPRSSAATYTGIWNEIRRVFAATKLARQRGYRASRFSFNAPGGRCEECKGAGVRRIAMRVLPDMEVTCPVCRGARFNQQTLAVRFRGQSVADVLAMSVDEAAVLFENHEPMRQVLQTLADVGLGYLSLGQPATTLSGGEAQRIKLATELARPAAGHTLYILDEPTTGLATHDIRRLLAVLQRLVDQGNSMVVIEHNLDVVKTADWVIDLGPEGGAGGGRVIAAGTPEHVATCEESHTGHFLRQLVE
jgi:excinuclease ABC subunit A